MSPGLLRVAMAIAALWVALASAAESPVSFAPLLQLGRSSEALQRTDTAIALAQKAIQYAELGDLQRLRADALYQLGRYQEAYQARLAFEDSDAKRRGAG